MKDGDKGHTALSRRPESSADRDGYLQSIAPTDVSKTEEPQLTDALERTPIDPQRQLKEQAQATDEQREQTHMDVIKEESHEPPVKAESPPHLSEFESLQAHLTQKRYDASAWHRLIGLAEESGDHTKIKESYESLLKAYPNTVRLFFLYVTFMFTLSDSYEYQSFSYRVLFEGRSADCIYPTLHANRIVSYGRSTLQPLPETVALRSIVEVLLVICPASLCC
jgi:hypothetical protein